jgi:hypothetical protein
VDLRGCGRDGGSKLCHGRLIIVLHDFREQLPGVDPLEVLYRHALYITGYLGGNRRQVGLQVGILRGLFSGVALPATPTRGDEHEHGQREHECTSPPQPTRERAPIKIKARFAH